MRISGRLQMRHLELFVEVARQKSVSRAAEALHLTQPAVSRSMRELEAVCGKPLFEKQGRGIRLSPYGALFLRHAGASLAAAREGLSALEALDAKAGPPLRIGALPTVLATLLPRAAKAYRDQGGLAVLRISSGNNLVLLNQLRDGQLDIVLGRLPAPENMLGLSFEPLYRERVIAVVRAGHPLLSRTGLRPDDLQRFPLLIPGENSIIRPFVERLFIEQGLSIPPNAVESVSPSFGMGFALQADAIWVISRGVVQLWLQSGDLAELDFDTASTLGSVGICLRSDGEPAPTARQFEDILRQTAQGLGVEA